MEKIITALSIVLLFFSCKKESTPTNTDMEYTETYPNELTGTQGQIYDSCVRENSGGTLTYFSVFISGKIIKNEKFYAVSILCKHDTMINGKPGIVLPDTVQTFSLKWRTDTVNVKPGYTSYPLIRTGWVFE